MNAVRNIHIVPFELAMMRTVHYWLNYMSRVSRIDLLAEDAIKFPLLEYIERNVSINKGQTEQNYDEFLTKGFFNTDKFIDISFKDEKTEYFIELKYVKNDTKAKNQLYFNDLVRLSLALRVNNSSKNRRCFLVVCGKATEFKEKFHGRKTQGDMSGGDFVNNKRGRKPTNPFAKWLRFDFKTDNGYKEIVYDPNATKGPFKNFIKEYFEADKKANDSKKKKKIDREENVTYLGSFYTKLRHISEENDDEQSTGLWEVVLTKES